MRPLMILALSASPAYAAQCSVANVQKQQVVFQQAYASNLGYGQAIVLKQVAPYAYYSVGASIQEEAVAERIARLVTKKLEAKAMKAAATPEAPLGLQILQNSCAKCHMPDSKAVVGQGSPVLFDENKALTASPEQIGSIKTVVKNGIMPPQPAEPLDDDSYLAIKQYLSK